MGSENSILLLFLERGETQHDLPLTSLVSVRTDWRLSSMQRPKIQAAASFMICCNLCGVPHLASLGWSTTGESARRIRRGRL